MCDKFINKEDSSPIGLEAEKPILPVKVLSCFAELNPTTESDSLLNLVFDTLLTLSV